VADGPRPHRSNRSPTTIHTNEAYHRHWLRRVRVWHPAADSPVGRVARPWFHRPRSCAIWRSRPASEWDSCQTRDTPPFTLHDCAVIDTALWDLRGVGGQTVRVTRRLIALSSRYMLQAGRAGIAWQ